MKRLFYFLFLFLISHNAFALNQLTHQYLTIQDYKLLQLSLILQYPAMSNHLEAFKGNIGE
jgi:hypothetical protein